MPAPARLRPPKSLLSLFLVLGPLIVGLPWLTLYVHYTLPTPLVDLYDNVTGLPQLSEERMLYVAKYLSEDIGYRTVGTREHAIADGWMEAQLVDLQRLCQNAVKRKPGRQLECEIWRQEGNGKHRFDIMHHKVFKSYHKLTNHILRISSGSEQSKELAVLVNSHLDSTIPSPGAADDAICVGVMLELIRVFIQTDTWEPTYSIVFLFNHGEESLQDASHLFSTQHELVKTIRAAINLEAAGTTGPELLFQATSEEMIKAYSHVPRPHGSVLANDVFNSGIILSDTDFGQFVQYMNVTGLDMAIVGNSYLYHTRKDLVEHIQPGVAQHMAENVYALLLHLASEGSPLPHLTEFTKPATVYYSLLTKVFLTYSYDLALKMSIGILFLATGYAIFATGDFTTMWRAVVGVLGGFLAALALTNLVAFIMTSVLDKGMSWFSREYLPLVLYAPPALLGAITVQLLVHPPPARPSIEHQSLTSVILFYAIIASAMQSYGIGSAYLPFLNAVSCLIAGILNSIFSTEATRAHGDVAVWAYAVGQLIPLVAGTEALAAFVDIFVPLTGRLGRDAPAENLIATIVAAEVFYMMPFLLPFAHRFGRPSLRTFVSVLAVITIAIMAVFASPGWNPFDVMHQRRVFVTHVENITSGDFGLHISTLTSAPGFPALVKQLAEDLPSVQGDSRLSVSQVDLLAWDSLFPVSEMVTSYAMDLYSPEAYVSRWANEFVVRAVENVVDESQGTRTIDLVIDHPGLIWTVLSFQAEVLSWNLPTTPPPSYELHKIKEASFYLSRSWSVRMTINQTTPLLVNYVGIEEASMWPGKKGQGRSMTMDLFEKMDGWMNEYGEGSIDLTLFGCVAGATEL